MNQTLRQRSALIQAAEHAHNQRKRPAFIGELLMAEYNLREPDGIYGDRLVVVLSIALIVIWWLFA